jgi:hypothetical protein
MLLLPTVQVDVLARDSMSLIRFIPNEVLNLFREESLQNLVFYRCQPPDADCCTQFYNCSTLVIDASATAPPECNGMNASSTLTIEVIHSVTPHKSIIAL